MMRRDAFREVKRPGHICVASLRFKNQHFRAECESRLVMWVGTYTGLREVQTRIAPTELDSVSYLSVEQW